MYRSRRLQQLLFATMTAFLLVSLEGCSSPSPSGIWVKEPPYTEDGLVDAARYDVPVLKLELKPQVRDELLEDIEALKEAQKRLNVKMKRLQSEGVLPPTTGPSVVSLSLDTTGTITMMCFPGGWSWL